MSTTSEAEPDTIEKAKSIINDIRFSKGLIDSRDDAELRKTSLEYQQKVRRNAKELRRVQAKFTKR
jgi:hypothetical protein